jgi:hypothetical protein
MKLQPASSPCFNACFGNMPAEQRCLKAILVIHRELRERPRGAAPEWFWRLVLADRARRNIVTIAPGVFDITLGAIFFVVVETAECSDDLSSLAPRSPRLGYR